MFEVLLLITLALYIIYSTNKSKTVEKRNDSVKENTVKNFLNFVKDEKPTQDVRMYRIDNEDIIECTQSLFDKPT